MSTGSPGRRRPAARLTALAILLAACRLGAAYADNATPPATPSATQPPKAGGDAKPAPQVTPSQRTLEPIAHEAAAGILGTKAEGPDGEDMGLVVDVVVDRDSRPTAVVIDFGGFLGVGSRKIAVDWSALSFPASSVIDHVVLNLTPDQVRLAPEYRPGEPLVVLGAAEPVQPKPDHSTKSENSRPEK